MDDRPPPDASAIGAQVRPLTRSVPRGALGTVGVARPPFDRPVRDAGAARVGLVRLAERARGVEAAGGG